MNRDRVPRPCRGGSSKPRPDEHSARLRQRRAATSRRPARHPARRTHGPAPPVCPGVQPTGPAGARPWSSIAAGSATCRRRRGDSDAGPVRVSRLAGKASPVSGVESGSGVPMLVFPINGAGRAPNTTHPGLQATRRVRRQRRPGRSVSSWRLMSPSWRRTPTGRPLPYGCLRRWPSAPYVTTRSCFLRARR